MNFCDSVPRKAVKYAVGAEPADTLYIFNGIDRILIVNTGDIHCTERRKAVGNLQKDSLNGI